MEDSHSSWPGLSRPSTSRRPCKIKDVDARHKAGHDGGETVHEENQEMRWKTLNRHGRACHRVSLSSSWPGLSRPSTSRRPCKIKDVDARHKAGHDGGEAVRFTRQARA